MRNIYLIVGSWIILAALVVIGGLAIAAPYVPPKTFAPGDPILSSDFNTMNSTLAASINNITAAQITDSTITSGKVSASFFSGAVKYSNNAIDSGAIAFDTQFHPSWSLPTARLVSSTDSAQNFTKMISGYYIGDGTDMRIIYNTRMVGPNKQSASGVNIPFTVTRVEVKTAWGVNDGNYQYATCATLYDGLSDSFVVIQDYSNEYMRAEALNTSGFYHGNGIPAIYNSSDSHGFRVSSSWATNGSYANLNGIYYVFTAWGY